MSHASSNPWYREPWPWFILGLLSLGVVAGSTMAVIGLSNPPERVTGQYERLGRGLTDIGDRTARARELGLAGSLGVDGDYLRIRLAASDAGSLPETLVVRFQHPAASDGDVVVRVERDSSGDYTGRLHIRPHERSHLVVADAGMTWWLAGRLDGLGPEPVDIVPKRL